MNRPSFAASDSTERADAGVSSRELPPVVVMEAGGVEEAVARQVCASHGIEPFSPTDLERAVPGDPDATALLLTSSRLSEVAPQIVELVERGFHVASACEELTYPWLHPEPARLIDEVATQRGKAVVGCGLHAGVALSVLPAMLAALAQAPWCISISVRADARRMEELGRTLGIGLVDAEWERRKCGREGLLEAAYLCALAAGWEPVDEELRREPIVQDGTVVGVRERVDVECDGEQWVSMELLLETDAPDEGRIKVSAPHPVNATVTGVIEGYEATAARLAEVAHALPDLTPGLRLPLELPAWNKRQS
jgi:hypothetical protein